MLEIKKVSSLDGKANAPPSKAHTLRALFMAALAQGKSVIKNPLLAQDQRYTIEALKEFGIKINVSDECVEVLGTGGKLELPSKEVFVGNSGLAIRMLATFASLAPNGKIVITGDKRMQTGRPIQDLLDALGPLGIKSVSVNGSGCPPIEIEGKSFEGGKTKLNGNISSQYFSSILLFAPYALGDVEIETIGEMRSKPYIDVTIELMREFGVKVENHDYKKFFVKAGQCYNPMEYIVEGDYSNASFFFAAAAVTSGTVSVSNLKLGSAQGDKVFLDCLEKMGCSVERKNNLITVKGGKLSGITVDMNDYPDLVPPLCIVGAFAKGKTTITNVAHLRFKECDRLSAMATELEKIGVKVETTDDSIIVEGCANALHGAEIETYNDHRIAMSFAIAGLGVKGIKIKNPDCVKKSFPDFFERLKELCD